MTVSSTTTKVSYSGDNSTTVFAYTFKIFDDDDITVILRTDATGSEAVQTKTTNYSVSGVGETGGGNITFVSPPASGITVVLLRETAQTQTTDYTPNDPFPASSHENALDKMTLIVQDQQEEINRALKLSRTNTMTSTEFEVGATTRANKILAFDDSGELAVTQEIGTFQGSDATTTTSNYNQRDIVKSTTAGQLNNVYICVLDSPSGTLLTNTTYWQLLVDAVSAATSATNAASSATDAETAQTAAEAAQAAAETAETNAATSASNASTSETNAATSATNAATSESNAATSETNAATSASSASTSATSAATSATTATTQASAASTSATNAATSETNASNSASAAATSETNAATSETNAATSETNAATSATSAETAKTAAETAQAAAELAADNFDDTYLGAKTSDPTVDNDGDALNAGDLFFNTTSSELKYYTGSAWEAIAPGITDVVSDTTPQLGGNLDLNSNDITGTGNIDITGGLTTTNNVGIGTSSPSVELEIASSAPQMRITDTDTNAVFQINASSTTGGVELQADATNVGSSPFMAFDVGGTERMRIDSSGTVTIAKTAVAATQTASVTGSQTPDFATYQNFLWTLTGNITLANPTTEKQGQTGFFIFIHSGGARTVSLQGQYATAGGAGLTLSGTAGAVDIVPYIVRQAGFVYLGTPQLAFA